MTTTNPTPLAIVGDVAEALVMSMTFLTWLLLGDITLEDIEESTFDGLLYAEKQNSVARVWLLQLALWWWPPAAFRLADRWKHHVGQREKLRKLRGE